MRPNRSTLLAGLVTFSLFLACEGALVWGGFTFLENRSFDLRVRWAPPRQPPPPEIVVIDIDNASFAALREAVGRWPWTRLLWSELVRFLDASGARVIVFDAIFSGRESESVDQEFAQAVAEAGNVVLAFAFVQYEAEVSPGSRSPIPEHVPGAVPLEDAAALPLLEAQKYKSELPVEQLLSAARALGCITTSPDSDGLVRRYSLFYRSHESTYPSLAVAAAGHALDLQKQGTPRLTSTDFRWGSLRVPITREGSLVPHWRPHPRAYPRLPLWKVTCSVFPDVCAEGKRFYAAEDFRDKFVIIGASAAGAFDVFATPVARVTPGFLLHAAALESLLQQRAIRETPPYLIHVLLALFAGLALVAVWGLRSVRRSTLMVAALVGLYIVAAFEVFARWELWLPMAAPLTLLVASFVGNSLTRYVTTGRELRQTRQTLSRYMSPKVVEHILAHGGPDQLRGQRRVITVMMSDVRNFTKMSERRTPTEVLEILNRYLDAMTEIVFAHSGVVDKFIGDGILCYWGAFGDSDSHADLAVKTAAQMLAKLQELNQNWQAQGLPDLNIGIGINTGEAVFGNLGAGKKVEFTVLGDTVNVAARLEAMNKQFGTRVIFSETTQALLGAEINVRSLGEVEIRGREQKMKIYTLRSDT